MRRLAPVLLAVALVAILCGACGSHTAPDRLVVVLASADAGGDVADVAPPKPLTDGSPFLGGPCIDDGQCNDGIACTYDSCDQTLGRCVNVPDDTLCDDGVYCDGKERCAVGQGCQRGAVVSCSNGQPCFIATCVEATKSCSYAPRDVDQDGDPDGHCSGGHDCNDLDPAVSSLHAEVCGNGVDDNCNGVIDESPCVDAPADSCASAAVFPGAGTYSVSTLGAGKHFATSCSVTAALGAEEVAAAVTVPPGPKVDLQVWATSADGSEVAVAIDGTCAEPASELACASGRGVSSLRARARSVSPGTYDVVVTTQVPGTVQVEVDLLPATSRPTDVDCASAAPITPGTPATVTVLDSTSKLPSLCSASASTGTLTYGFTLSQPQDVRVFASTSKGAGKPVVGLRSAGGCATAAGELGCIAGASIPVYARAAPAGSYVVTIAGTASIDATVDVELSPPSAAPPDATCAAPPAIGANATVAFDLANHEQAIRDGCYASAPDFGGGATAAYDLTLPAASDVLLVERLPQTDKGAVSLDQPACDSGSMLAQGCATGGANYTGSLPVRLGKRNVQAGDYRVVVADFLSLEGTLDALVRPTVAPTIVPAGGADTCATAIDVSSGGFFTGDTTTATPDFSNPCDQVTTPGNGAPDQVLELKVTQRERVVLDMEGSQYLTILDVRGGATCPGTPLANDCYVGFGAQKSFLDLRLDPGTYWLILDGYQGAAGAWNLDVRILPP